MWYVTALVLALGVWCGLELARAQQMPKAPVLAVLGGSTVILLVPLVADVGVLRLFVLFYAVLLAWAVVRAAPYRRALAGVSLLLVWANIGTFLVALLWGV